MGKQISIWGPGEENSWYALIIKCKDCNGNTLSYMHWLYESSYSVHHSKLYFFNYLYQIWICKLDFVWKWFWNSEIWEILLLHSVFMKCILCTILHGFFSFWMTMTHFFGTLLNYGPYFGPDFLKFQTLKKHQVDLW